MGVNCVHVAAAALTLFAMAGQGRATTLDFKKTSIRLGMDRAAVEDRVKAFRKVKTAGNENRMTLYDGKELIGAIVFSPLDQRVVSASRTWVALDEKENPLDFGRALSFVMERAAKESGPNARINAYMRRGPTAEWHITTFDFKDRRFVVTSQTTSERLNTLYLEEEIGDRDGP